MTDGTRLPFAARSLGCARDDKRAALGRNDKGRETSRLRGRDSEPERIRIPHRIPTAPSDCPAALRSRSGAQGYASCRVEPGAQVRASCHVERSRDIWRRTGRASHAQPDPSATLGMTRGRPSVEMTREEKAHGREDKTAGGTAKPCPELVGATQLFATAPGTLRRFVRLPWHSRFSLLPRPASLCITGTGRRTTEVSEIGGPI